MINSLIVGFGILGRRVEFLLIPVILSVFAFLLPPVDISVLISQLETSLGQIQTLSPTMDLAPDGADTAPALEALGMENVFSEQAPWNLGDTFPLEIILINRMFFRVPGYINFLPMAETLSPWSSLAVTSLGDLLLLFVGALAGGILLGTLYLYQLGQQVTAYFARFETSSEIEAKPVQDTTTQPNTAGFWPRTGQMFLYFIFLLAVWFASAFLLALILGIFSLAAPQATGGILYFAFSLALVAYPLFLYYQTYVTAGVMMDGLTAWTAFRTSLQLVQQNFLPTLLFLFLAGFIMLGIELLLENLISLTGNHTLGGLAAGLIFAYVGTGVALAFLVFYRIRLLAQQGMDITQYFETQET